MSASKSMLYDVAGNPVLDNLDCPAKLHELVESVCKGDVTKMSDRQGKAAHKAKQSHPAAVQRG